MRKAIERQRRLDGGSVSQVVLNLNCRLVHPGVGGGAVGLQSGLRQAARRAADENSP